MCIHVTTTQIYLFPMYKSFRISIKRNRDKIETHTCHDTYTYIHINTYIYMLSTPLLSTHNERYAHFDVHIIACSCPILSPFIYIHSLYFTLNLPHISLILLAIFMFSSTMKLFYQGELLVTTVHTDQLTSWK